MPTGFETLGIYMELPKDDNLIAEVHYYYHNDDWSLVREWNSLSGTQKVNR